MNIMMEPLANEVTKSAKLQRSVLSRLDLYTSTKLSNNIPRKNHFEDSAIKSGTCNNRINSLLGFKGEKKRDLLPSLDLDDVDLPVLTAKKNTEGK